MNQLPRPCDRKPLVEKSHPRLTVQQQCILLCISKSNYYYKPVGESEQKPEVMREIDKIHFECPFYGVKRMKAELQNRGFSVGEKLVRRFMRMMGIETIYPRPKTSIAAPEHVKYPYLLRGLQVTKTNQVWEMDITYIPMRHGFMYLSAIIDVFSRRIMGWGLSNTMEAEWCAGIVDEAFKQYGRPEIFNTDQGCQFTSEVFISTLQKGDDDTHKIKISMDGRGRATDDIYIERFWRSIKYEDLYVKAYENGESLYDGINSYMMFYNGKRLHESLDYQTPDKIYYKVS